MKSLDIAELHAQLDRDWQQVIEKIPHYDLWTRRAILIAWSDDKLYLNRYYQKELDKRNNLKA